MTSLALLALLSVVTAAPTPSEPAVEPDTCTKAPQHFKLGDINGEGIMPVVVGLNEVVQNHETEAVIEINSRGGSVGLGFGLIQLMRQAHDEFGVHIRCEVVSSGLAASMGAVIFELGCDERVMHATSTLMFHEPSVHDVDTGKAGEFRRLADELDDLNHHLAIMLSSRFKWTARQYENWVRGHDRWLDLDEAREHHLVDSWLP